MGNSLILSVAGSGKTHGIANYCASVVRSRRILVLTFTRANQLEVATRLRRLAPNHEAVEVVGWYTFLLRDFVRPFIPFKFPARRVLGFNFDGRPHRYATGHARFMDKSGAVYACELARLASELVGQSGGALLRRLQCLYDEIVIDEVQDLSGHDWDILDELLPSTLDLRLVGDLRQAVLSTNPRSSKNKKYANASAVHYFRERASRGELTIEEQNVTRRCHPLIARFSDSIFAPSFGFAETQSMNQRTTEHDGVFLLSEEHVDAYRKRFMPRCLRHSASSGKAFDLDYCNFKQVKGLTFERVLIIPTSGIAHFLRKGKFLPAGPASAFYVAVTRAAQSVAIVLDKPGACTLPQWSPIASCPKTKSPSDHAAPR